MRTAVLLAAAVVAATVAPVSQGTTVSKSIKVTATVEQFCSVLPWPELAFGSYGSVNANLGEDLDGFANIQVVCPEDLPFTVGIDNGLNSMQNDCAADSPVDRRMTSENVFGGNLAYALYKDDTRTTPWGCAPENVTASVGTGGFQNFEIYGRIEGGQVTYSDDYSDTVQVLVVF